MSREAIAREPCGWSIEMGYEASCTLRLDGGESRGTARLEHKDLVFRGPVRLVIPLSDVRSATAEGRVLTIRFGERVARFDLGASATKWAARITNPPSRLDKLGVKPGMRVVAAGIPDPGFLAELESRGAVLVPKSAGTQPVDLVFHPAPDRRALQALQALRRRIAPAGAIWVVRPKGSKAITESETMAAGKRAGLVDVKVVSFSDAYTAEKFVIPLTARAASGAETGKRGAARRSRASIKPAQGVRRGSTR